MDLFEIQETEWQDSTHYFPDVPKDLVYFGCALAGEVGETCNLIKKNFRGNLRDSELKYELEKELPDILIYLVMLAAAMDIDLEKAYEKKKEFNNARYRGHSEVR